MQGLCAEKKTIGPRKRLVCSTLQSIADKESAPVPTSLPPQPEAAEQTDHKEREVKKSVFLYYGFEKPPGNHGGLAQKVRINR